MIEVYTFGYKDQIFRDFVEKLKNKEIKALIDTRFNPHCFSPFWKKKTLVDFLPIHNVDYHHIQELGNSRYFQKGKIKIQNLSWGIIQLKEIADDWECDKICLLCTCENFDTCHNKIIVEELTKDKNFEYKGRL